MIARLFVWLMLLWFASAAWAEQRDVIFVLDNSHAMTKMDSQGLASSAVAGAVERLGGDVRVAMVPFDQTATLTVPFTALTGESRHRFLEALHKLNYRGRYPDAPAALDRAIREFEVNGREGAEKWIILLTSGLGDTPDTALVQSRLSSLGYGVGPIDGAMGPKTRAAIRQFQMQTGMPADGKLNEALLARLEEVYRSQAPAALPEERPREAEETHIFFLHLMVMLLTARLFAEVAARLQAPPVIGELLAGIVIGPSLLGWISPTEVIKLLAEIGIILLLFEVGLETDMRQLARSGAKSVAVAAGGFVFPFLLGYGLSRGVLELDLLPALFVGGTLTATSIGITVRVLSDLKRQASHEGQVVLGAAVLDDIFGVVLLALLYEFATGGGASLVNAAKVLLFIALFFALATPAAKLLSLVIRRFDSISEIPGLLPTTIVALVLFFAWLAHAVGAPELLGGFAAGLALSRRFFLPFGVAIHADPEFAHRVEDQMKPIVHLFTPIFFVMVGLSLNLREVDWGSPFIWVFSLSLMAIAVIGKMAGAMLIRESWPARMAIGMAMVPRGEVGLIFAELGRVSGVFNNEIYAGMVIVIALTTLIPPFLMKWFYGRYGGRLPVAMHA